MTFVGSVLYFVSNADGKVYATIVGETVDQSSPKGIAYSKTGTERALWVILDGNPKDKILKVNPTTGALLTNFSTDGVHDAPSASIEGIEYLGDALYLIANEGSGGDTQRRLYKVNASSGNVESGYPKNLNNITNNDLGDITSDGTNLVLWNKSSFNRILVVDVQGSQVQEFFTDAPFQGARALAFHSGRSTYYGGLNTDVSSFDTNFFRLANFNISVDGSGTAITAIEGMVFDGDKLFTIAGSRIYQSFLAETVTNNPTAIAWSPSTAPGLGSSESLWIITNASPFDRILRVDTSNGALNTSFDSDGVADAPSPNIEGMTFITEGNDNYLYMVANDQGQHDRDRNLYKYDVRTRSVETGYPKNLGDAGIDRDLGALTYDGTDLIVFAKNDRAIWKITKTGSQVSQNFLGGSKESGVTGLAYHTTRGVLYGAKSNTLVLITNLQELSDQTLTLDGGSLNGVQGMAFGQDVLYVARTEGGNGLVSSGALKASVSKTVQGMAISPSNAIFQGQSIGEALWVAVDGGPKDRVKKVDIDPSSGTYKQPITAFGTDSTGSAELPSSNIRGITFFNNHLYAIGDSGNDPTLYKLNPITGAAIATTPLCGPGAQGCSVGQSVGGLSNDGTDLILYLRNQDEFVFIDESGNRINQRGQPATSGADAVAYITADTTYWSAKGSKIQQWVTPFGNEIFPSDTHELSGAGVQNIKGLAIQQTSKTIYIGWNDGTDGKVSQAVPPSPITNTLQDLAYNSDDGELYILVDGSGGDAVVAVNPSTGAVLTDSSGKDRFAIVNSEDARAVAYHNGEIFVAYEQRGFGGGQPPIEVSVRDAQTLAKVRTFDLGTNCGRVLGLDSDGTSLVGTVEFCGSKVETYDPGSGFKQTDLHLWQTNGQFNVEGFEDVAHSTSTPLYFVAKADRIYRVDDSGQVIDTWSVTDQNTNPLSAITGVEFVGSFLYVADASKKTVYKALVPLPTTNITNFPRAMATDGSSLWVAVDADPVDKILELQVSTSSATLLNSFDSPGTETDGLAIHGGDLWVLNNDTHNVELPAPGGGVQVVQITLPTLARLSTSTGEELFFTLLAEDIPGQPPDIVKDLLGGLASDGQILYSGTTGQQQGTNGELYAIDLNNIRQLCLFGECFAAPAVERVQQFAGVLDRLNSLQALEVAPSGTFTDDRRLILRPVVVWDMGTSRTASQGSTSMPYRLRRRQALSCSTSTLWRVRTFGGWPW